MRRKHDESYKLLFSQPEAVERLIRACAPALAERLDFTTLRKLSSEQVGPRLQRRSADLVWNVRIGDGGQSVLILLEFQMEIDRMMATRILEYTALAYRDLIRQGRRMPRRLLPILLGFVVYNGSRRWTAPDDIAELIGPVPSRLADWSVRQKHFVLDLRGAEVQALPQGNVLSWLAALERDSSAENVEHVIEAVLQRYPDPGHAELRRAFREWILGAARAWGLTDDILAKVDSLKEVGRMYAGIRELKEQWRRECRAEGWAEGRAAGRAEGRASLLCRQAKLKFGAKTAEELRRLLGDMRDLKQLALVGDWIIDCSNGAELLAKVREA